MLGSFLARSFPLKSYFNLNFEKNGQLLFSQQTHQLITQQRGIEGIDKSSKALENITTANTYFVSLYYSYHKIRKIESI